MKKLIIILAVIILAFMFMGLVEVKIYAPTKIVNNRLQGGNVPVQVKTYCSGISYEYSGNGVTLTTQVSAAVAKAIATRIVNYPALTLISADVMPTPTVTRTP
jgi:hypothetical protein